MRNQIRRLVRDSVHGGFLKLLALGARVAFLVLIIPDLPEGVLSGYMFANSVAILGATALVLGLDEELPRIIGGSVPLARPYARWFFVLSALGISGLVILLIVPSIQLAIFALLMTLTAGRILTGIIRSINPRISEQSQNLPWVSFSVVVIVLRLDQTLPLIATMTASLLLFQYLAAYTILKRDDNTVQAKSISLFALIRHGLFFGSSRLASNFFLLGALRGPVLWPPLLGLTANLDQVAFAIVIGELVAQFGHIPVIHAYARWCRSKPMLRSDWRNAVTTGLLLTTGLLALSSIAFLICEELGWSPKQATNFSLIISALLLSSLVPSFNLFKFLLWSRDILRGWIVVLTFAMFLLSLTVIYIYSMDTWFYGLALVLTGGGAVLVAKSRSYFELPKYNNPS